MQKKVKVIAVLIGLTVALWLTSLYVRLPFLGVHPHEAIPSHTALFLSLEKTQLQQIANGHAPKIIDEIFLPNTLKKDLISYESIFGETLAIPAENEILITVNPTQHSGIDLLFILPDCRGVDLENILQLDKGSRVRKSIFRNWNVFTVSKDDHTFCFAKYRNLLLVARKAYLVENALSQLKSPSAAVCNDAAFKSANRNELSENGYDIYLNINELGAQFAPLVEPSEQAKINGLNEIGHWLHLGFPSEKSSTIWSASLSPNLEYNLLNASKAAEEKPFKSVFPFIPADLTGFIWLSQNTFSPSVNTELWSSYFSAWASDEAVFAVGQQIGKAPAEKFFLLKTNDPKAAEASLEKLVQKRDNNEAYDFQIFKVWQLRSSGISEMLGTADLLKNCYATVLGEYVLFGNSKSGIDRWLAKYLSGQTFSKEVSFLESLQALPLDAQAFFYFENGATWQLANQMLNEDRGTYFNRNPFTFKHLVGTGTWKNGRLQCQLATPTAVSEERAPASVLWRLPLAGNAVGRPVISQNPKSGEAEILVKDDTQQVYLISNNGRIVWQYKIDEPILSEITEIDLRNDRDRQFVFSSRSAIYMLDEQGRTTAGYPLQLQVPATNGVTVVDFFQSHDYQFFLACENGNAYGFDERGSPVEGWRPNTGIGIVRHPMLHFQAGGKDYLTLLNGEGDLQVFQKNGSYRFPKVELESPFLQTPDFQSNSESSRIVTSDDEGRVHVTNFQGKTFDLKLKVGDNTDVKFAFADVLEDSRKEYIALSGKKMAVYFYGDEDFKKAYSLEFPWPQDEVFKVEIPGSKKHQIGTTSRSKKRIYLLEKKGKVVEHFPLEGTTPFIISDLLGNQRQVVITGNGRSICTYLLE